MPSAFAALAAKQTDKCPGVLGSMGSWLLKLASSLRFVIHSLYLRFATLSISLTD